MGGVLSLAIADGNSFRCLFQLAYAINKAELQIPLSRGSWWSKPYETLYLSGFENLSGLACYILFPGLP